MGDEPQLKTDQPLTITIGNTIAGKPFGMPIKTGSKITLSDAGRMVSCSPHPPNIVLYCAAGVERDDRFDWYGINSENK